MNLLCGGIDTVAEIAINGQPAGKTNNMFTRYIFDVKKLLKVSVPFFMVLFKFKDFILFIEKYLKRNLGKLCFPEKYGI